MFQSKSNISTFKLLIWNIEIGVKEIRSVWNEKYDSCMKIPSECWHLLFFHIDIEFMYKDGIKLSIICENEVVTNV